MVIGFENPLFLYSAAGGTIPILIHLLNRRKAKLQRFPSVEFILESQKKVARHYRLRQRLLLALRVLSIVAMALFLAGPRLVTGGGKGAVEAESNLASIIIVDNSLSMNYSPPSGKYIDLAKNFAEGLIKELTAQGTVAVAPLLSPDKAPWDLTPDIESALRILGEIKVSYEPSDIASTLDKAYASLKTVPPQYRKSIFFITDGTSVPWNDFSAAKLTLLDSSVKLKIVSLGRGQSRENAYLKGVSLPGYPVVGAPLSIEAVVESNSAEPMGPLQVELEVEGKTLQRKVVKTKPGEKLSLQFEFVASRAEPHLGKLSILKDNLLDDNVYYFTIPVRERVNALIVDGDPKTSLLNSETYYVVNALDPGTPSGRSPVAPKVVTVGEFNSMSSYNARVIILANVAGLTGTARRQLMDYVQAGGDLIFFLGDRVTPDNYNKSFHDSPTRLLPSRLENIEEAKERSWRIGSLDPNQLALAAFRGRESESLLSAQFKKAFRLERGDPEPRADPLLTLENGMPLLLEKEVGKGKVLLFTSTADRDWNDLGTKGAYLPLMQGLVRYLVRDEAEWPASATLAGRPMELPLSRMGSGQAVQIVAPDGRTLKPAISGEAGMEALRFTGTVPGFYQLMTPSESKHLALNASREESDLNAVSEQDLRNKFAEVAIEIVYDADSPRDILKRKEKSVSLSSALILSLFLALAAEGFIANKT